MSMHHTAEDKLALQWLLWQEEKVGRSRAIQACRKCGQWERALSLLVDMGEALMTPDMGSFRATIWMCKDNGQWQHVLSLLKKMQSLDMVLDASLFHAAMRSCYHSNQWGRVVSLIKQIRLAGVTPELNNFNLALWACAESGWSERAVDLLDDMDVQGVAPKLQHFRAAMVACVRGRSWKRALSLLDRMEVADVKPDVEIFNKAIYACEQTKQGSYSLSVLNRMHRAEISPNTASYSTAIRACQKTRENQNVLSVLKRIHKAGVIPDVVCCNAEISAFEEAGQWERALQLLDEMRSVGVTPDVFTLNTAMDICHKNGQWARASLLLDESHEEEVMRGKPKMLRLQEVSHMTDERLDFIFAEIKKIDKFRLFGSHSKLDFKVEGESKMRINPPYEFLQPLVSAITEIAEKLVGADQQLAILQLILNFFENGNSEVRPHRHRCEQICVSLGATRELFVEGKRLIMHHGDALYLKGQEHSVPAAEQVSDPRISVCLFFGASVEYQSGSISVQQDQRKRNSQSGQLWWFYPGDEFNAQQLGKVD